MKAMAIAWLIGQRQDTEVTLHRHIPIDLVMRARGEDDSFLR